MTEPKPAALDITSVPERGVPSLLLWIDGHALRSDFVLEGLHVPKAHAAIIPFRIA
jgi:hypothetical protein